MSKPGHLSPKVLTRGPKTHPGSADCTLNKHDINVFKHVKFDMNDNVFWFVSSF